MAEDERTAGFCCEPNPGTPSPLNENDSTMRGEKAQPGSEHRVGIIEEPQNMPGQHDVEDPLGERRSSGVSFVKVDVDSRFLGFRPGARKHRARNIDPRQAMPALSKEHSKAARTAAEIGNPRGALRQQWLKEQFPRRASFGITEAVVDLIVEVLGKSVPQGFRFRTHCSILALTSD